MPDVPSQDGDDEQEARGTRPEPVERNGVVYTRHPTVPRANEVFTPAELEARLEAHRARIYREMMELGLRPAFDAEEDEAEPEAEDVITADAVLVEKLRRAAWPRGRSFRDFKYVQCHRCGRMLLGTKSETIRAEARLQNLILARLLPPESHLWHGRPTCRDCLETL